MIQCTKTGFYVQFSDESEHKNTYIFGTFFGKEFIICPITAEVERVMNNFIKML